MMSLENKRSCTALQNEKVFPRPQSESRPIQSKFLLADHARRSLLLEADISDGGRLVKRGQARTPNCNVAV